MMQKEIYWSRFASDFEERNNYVVGKKDMHLILNKISEQKNLKNTLELGCGNGTYSKVLALNAYKLLATDFSDEMVEASKIRLKSSSNIEVEKANCFDLPYDDYSFDTVFLANLLHIVPEPERVIPQLYRVLKKEGKVIIISFTVEGMTFMNKLRMFYRYLKTYGKPSPYAQTLYLKNVENMLVEQGFEIKRSELLGKRMKAIFLIAVKRT